MRKQVLTALFVALAFGSLPSASYAGVSVQVGVKITCTISVSAATIPVSNGTDATNVNGFGSAQFLSIATTQEPIASTDFSPVSLTFNGSDPTYGSFNFSFDATRPPTTTNVTSNQPGVDFPATANVYANVTGTISSLPGTYVNNQELHLVSNNLHSFNPQVNEFYRVASDVTFSNLTNPLAPTFTIKAGSTVVLS